MFRYSSAAPSLICDQHSGWSGPHHTSFIESFNMQCYELLWKIRLALVTVPMVFLLRNMSWIIFSYEIGLDKNCAQIWCKIELLCNWLFHACGTWNRRWCDDQLLDIRWSMSAPKHYGKPSISYILGIAILGENHTYICTLIHTPQNTHMMTWIFDRLFGYCFAHSMLSPSELKIASLSATGGPLNLHL